MKKGIAALATVAIATTGLVITGSAAYASPHVTGKVFRDYGGDGAYTPGTDTYLGGVTVTAHFDNGDAPVTAKSTHTGTATGNYSLNVPENKPMRIEFTGLPAGLSDTFGQSNVQFITSGANASNTAVDYGVIDVNQYSPITSGNSANPTLGTAIMVAGGRNNDLVKNEPVLVGTKWNVTENVLGRDMRDSGDIDRQVNANGHGLVKANPWEQRVTWATYGQVGSVFSLASDSQRGNVYAAASYKRLSDLGPEGLGGIYVVTNAVNQNDGSPQAGDELLSFDVTALGIDVGQSELAAAGRGLAEPNKLLTETHAFAHAAKLGIGGMAVDAETSILYFVNLYDQKIYAIDVSDLTRPKLIGSGIPTAAAPAAETGQRAFALTLHEGNLYVGYNDTGELGESFQPLGWDQRFFVDRIPALLTGQQEWDASTKWVTVLDGGSLDYIKGNPVSGWGGVQAANDLVANYPQILRWNTWTDKWSKDGSTASPSVGISQNQGSSWGNIHVYPQPLVSGIAFDREGFMTVGIMDRTQLQSGNQNCAAGEGTCSAEGTAPVINGTNKTTLLWQTLSSGDTLIAAPTSDATGNTGWVLESNGTVGLNMPDERPGTPNSRVQERTTGEGPGAEREKEDPVQASREFFNDRQKYGTQGTAENNVNLGDGNHRENTLGSVAIVPGTADQVASNAYDPLGPVRVVGVQWFNLQNGDRARGYQHTWDPGDPALLIEGKNENSMRSSFQKGGGMGGLTLLSQAAPVEIGDRAWLDLNSNGLQDVGEPSIQNAIVELRKKNADGTPGDLVNDTGSAVKVTDANGKYFFRSATSEVGTTLNPGATEGFRLVETQPGDTSGTAGQYGDYVVVFKPGTTALQLNWHGVTPPVGFITPTWQQLEFTKNVSSRSDLDSNAIAAGPIEAPNSQGNAVVSVGSAGQNDHTIDAGWHFPTVSVGDYVWNDKNRNGIQDDTDAGIEGVRLKLFLVKASESGAEPEKTELTRDVYGAQLTGNVTNAEGKYSFTGLPLLGAGEHYRVEIDTDAGTQGALATYVPTLTNVQDPANPGQLVGRDVNSNTGFATTEDAPVGSELTVSGREDNTLDFGFFSPVPSATIIKDGKNLSGDYVVGDTADTSVNLTKTGADLGETELRYTVVNNGEEDLYDVVVTDTVTLGAAEITDMSCTFLPGSTAIKGELNHGDTWVVKWADTFATADERAAFTVGQSFECVAQLEGIIGEHANKAEISGIGVVSGLELEHQAFTPQTPEKPAVLGTENPFYAHRTPAVSVGDRVWLDTNRDGVQARDTDNNYDPAEPGIDGVVLEIVNQDRQPVMNVVTGERVPNQTTSGGGFYNFVDLPVLQSGESYIVRIVGENTVLQQLVPTEAGVIEGTDNGAYDSSTNEAVNREDLDGHGDHDDTLDFGFMYKKPGATITKTDDSSTPNDANTRDTAVDLGPSSGATKIVFTISNDQNQPITNIGLSDLSSGSGAIEYPIILEIDGGNYPLQNVFDSKDATTFWPGELLPGQQLKATAWLRGVTSDEAHQNTVELFATGKFNGEPVEDPNNPSGDPTKPNRPTDTFHAVVKTYAIGDVVWVDHDEDGEQDTSELPLENVTVRLYQADASGAPVGGAVATQKTDAEGLYLFDGLVAGDYVVEFERPAGYRFTVQDKQALGASDPEAIDSDAHVETGLTAKITLGNGSVTKDYKAQTFTATEGIDPTWDAGVIPDSVSVGDLVWVDTNRDGLQDTNEPGIENVGLTLKRVDAAGTEHTVIDVLTRQPVANVTTDENGAYVFTNLPVLAPGESYRVYVDAASVDSRYTPTTAAAGDLKRDSSTEFATTDPNSLEFSLLVDGGNDPTLDFGFVLKTLSATITKSDKAGNAADTAGAAADLAPTGGATEIVFTIVNSGQEPITNIKLVDVASDKTSVYPIELTTEDGTPLYTLKTKNDVWNGQIASGETILGTAQLSGVNAQHKNVVTLWAEGALTGDPVVDSQNPGTDPSNPKRPSNEYHADVFTYAVGDYVWIDRNRNGGQDAGESPLKGVTVVLRDSANKAVGDSVQTDDQGYYQFDGLPSGSYRVEFTLPDGYVFTTQNDPRQKTSEDSDAHVKSGLTGTIVLDKLNKNLVSRKGVTASEGIDPTWDAGVVPESVSVGDFVWQDLDRDGTQDAGEPGIDGVTVTLTGPDGAEVTNVFNEPVKPVVTENGGRYEFTDLPVLGDNESYTVTVSGVPDRFTPTVQEPGTNGEGELDSSTGSAQSQVALTEDGAKDATLDFGFVLKTPGATVSKSDVEARSGDDPDQPVDLSVTGGAVELVFTITNNGEEPITNIGLSDATVAGVGMLQYPIVLQTSSGEFALADANSRWNGALAVGESVTGRALLSGVTAGDQHANTVTLFADGVLTGSPVQDPTKPSEDPTKPNRPTDSYHAVVKSYAIGDYVWIDTDPNNVQDAAEPGLGGVVVYLLDQAGNRIADRVTTTDANGYYQFDNLGAGTYAVEFELPFGYVLVKPQQGEKSWLDSDAVAALGSNGARGQTVTFVLDGSNTNLDKRDGVQASEGIDPTWDAGVRLATVLVGDRVWVDSDRDGRQGTDEPGIPGVVLEVFGPDQVKIAETVTDADGSYRFEDLPVLPEGQSYTVRIDPERSQDALGDLVPTTENVGDRSGDSSTGEESTEGLNSDGQSDLTLDFGYLTPSVSVGDRVWIDSNRDGQQTPGEPGLPGVVLIIVGPDGKPVTDVFGQPVEPQITDEYGNYLFSNLPALPSGQSYVVKIDREASADALAGLSLTITSGAPREDESSEWEGSSKELTTNGDAEETLDFGFVRPSVSIGDTVWEDTNGNGRQDDHEPGIPGVVLVVTDRDGNPVMSVLGDPVLPVTTDADGHYLFADLPALGQGDYYVVKIDQDASQDALNGFSPTLSGQGDAAGDSSEWVVQTVGLTGDGDRDLTLDFGFVRTPVPAENGLSMTGSEFSLVTLGAGALGVVLLGAGLLLAVRRRAEQRA